MSASKPATAERASDAERAMLRKSVRDFLSRRWPPATAVENANNAEAVATLWREMAGQGLAEGANFARLPDGLQKKANAQLAQIKLD